MGPSLFPWGFWEKPRHDDKRRSHVLGQFPQGRPTPSPYQTTTPSTSHPNSSSALGDPAAAGDLRLGHRAPGRGGRRASIPLHALTTLLSALGAFCLCEFRVSQQISTFYGPSVQAIETRLGARQRRRPPTVHRLWEFRVFSTNLNILRSICSGHGDPARRAAATAAPDGSPRSYPRPTPTAASGQ